MWRFKQLIPKEQAGLEGKSVEVGSLKLHIRSVIAQGGFSSVYLAKDARSGKLYAVKHIICNDAESVDLAKKEVAVMKLLQGHPNVVTLHAQSMYDMGRTKECFLVMEYCDKMLVNVLDGKEGEYIGEKQVLLIFRDVCNAVYAMHCQSPPIAHRDLKAENVLLGSDGLWKLCDFGSTSTNHKRFERVDEMGIEEDLIRKHTTPAYRAPEMWDLYRRDIISEKVDIWALGCLLYRIAFLKSAFDGESKLQILNGNYRFPDSPKLSYGLTGLIKDMLNSSPEMRPDAKQVWMRVNELLPLECRKACPDEASSRSLQVNQNSGEHIKAPIMPTRAPPLPPTESQYRSPPPSTHKDPDRIVSSFTHKESDQRSSEKRGVSMGSFWSTQYAQAAKCDPEVSSTKDKSVHSPPQMETKNTNVRGTQVATDPYRDSQSSKSKSRKDDSVSSSKTSTYLSSLHVLDENSLGPKFDEDILDDNMQMEESLPAGRPLHEGNAKLSTDEAFTEFVAEFQKTGLVLGPKTEASGNNDQLRLELDRLRRELSLLQAEKADIASKYEKLTAICRSQRLEIQELKNALVEANKTNNIQSSRLTSTNQESHMSSPSIVGHVSKQKQDRPVDSVWDLQGAIDVGGSKRMSSFEQQQMWKAFDDEGDSSQTEALSRGRHSASEFNTNKQVSGGDGGGSGTSRTSENSKKRAQVNTHSRAASFGVGDGCGVPHDSFGNASGSTGFEAMKWNTSDYSSKQQVSGIRISSRNRQLPPTTATSALTNTTMSGTQASTKQTQPAGWAGF